MKSIVANVLLLAVLFLTSCAETTTNNVEPSHTLNMVSDLMKLRSYGYKCPSFSDIITEIEFVPLESQKECMLTSIEKIKIDGDKIFIFNEGANLGVFVFDISGKYLNKIGDMGSSKQEYIYIEDMTIDTENKLVLLLGMDEVKIYDYDGKYIKTVQLNQSSRFRRIESNQYGYWFASPHMGLDHLLHQYDKDFNPIKDYFKISTEMTLTAPTFNNPIQCDGNQVCYFDDFESKYGLIEFGDTISVGTYKFHTGKEKTFAKHQKYKESLFYDEMLSFCFANGKSVGDIVLDRFGGFNFLVDYATNTIRLIPNEDCFMAFLSYYSDGYYYSIMAPEDLEEYFLSPPYISNETKELFKKRIATFKYPLTPESNYILTRSKINEKVLEEYE